MALYLQGANKQTLLTEMNQIYAVTRYGGQTVIAIIGKDKVETMKTDDFHKMFANILGEASKKDNPVSISWFRWRGRRQYIGRGVVFEPGGPLEVPGDMLNLWRGFGVVPSAGDWPLMRAHILNVVCSGNQKHFDYLIQWMAYRVKHPDKPMGVAVAFLGAQGAGKGVVARTFGRFFGNHFAHIAHGDQLTGRFNQHLVTACVAFLDEALWAGDKKGEGVLKALITEPALQLEAKFRDPITVQNRLCIIVASNNEWAVPTGIGDRRWFVLNVANTYAGMEHQSYWAALYQEVDNGGAAAMLHDLLAMDLSKFNIRAVPHTKAKAQQQVHSLRGPMSWLYQVLQDGAISMSRWQATGLTISKDGAYDSYKEFTKERREYQPEIKSVWSKNVLKALGSLVKVTRPVVSGQRVRTFEFATLDNCRRRFEEHTGLQNLEWEETGDTPSGASIRQTGEIVQPAEPAPGSQPADPREQKYDPDDDGPSEWEPSLDPDDEYRPEYDPVDDPKNWVPDGSLA
ncbi:MAG TPA: primase-helicase family protein [Blastocatellia bacterium]